MSGLANLADEKSNSAFGIKYGIKQYVDIKYVKIWVVKCRCSDGCDVITMTISESVIFACAEMRREVLLCCV